MFFLCYRLILSPFSNKNDNLFKKPTVLVGYSDSVTKKCMIREYLSSSLKAIQLDTELSKYLG